MQLRWWAGIWSSESLRRVALPKAQVAGGWSLAGVVRCYPGGVVPECGVKTLTCGAGRPPVVGLCRVLEGRC